MTLDMFIAWALSEGANLKGLAEYCGTPAQMIEQSYGRYIRKDFLGPLVAARPRTLQRAAAGEKTGPPTGPPIGGCGKKARISDGILVEAGGIEPPSEDLQELATTRLVRGLELARRPPTDGLPESQPV
jgi:hypothetical protein